MKNQKGVTIVALTITVILFTIILTAVTFSSISSIHIRRLYNMYEDILLLQGRLNMYYIQENAIPILTTPDDGHGVKAFDFFTSSMNEITSIAITNETEGRLKVRSTKINPNDAPASAYSGWQTSDYVLLNVEALKDPKYGGDFELNNEKPGDYYAVNKRSLQVYYCNGVSASEDLEDFSFSIPFDSYNFVN